MTTVSPPLSAAVLAGGKSSRMGQDKALVPLAVDGPALIAIVIAQLHEVADEVLVVANDLERYARFGARVVPDREPGIGALGGIATALREASARHCLVVACDMPFLNGALLRLMAREPRSYDALVPLLPGHSRQRGDGLVYQTLHAIYSKNCLEPIEHQIRRGNRQVIGFFDDIQVRTLDMKTVQSVDPDLRSFFNANTPAALVRARELATTREPMVT